MGFKIRTLQHVLEGYKVAKEIAAHGAGASTFSDWWSYKIEAYDATPYNAAIIGAQRRCGFAELGFRRIAAALEPGKAAKTMRYGGLSETEALAMVTINPAKQLGIDDKVGSIEVGKSADLVLFDQHPLSGYSKPLKVWIDGHQYFDRDKDLEMRPGFEQQKKALQEKQSAEGRGGRGRGAAPPAAMNQLTGGNL